MLLPVESIYAGNWSGTQPVPEEYEDFELMRGMGWSWSDLERTPAYVRRYCADLLGLRAQAEQAANDKASKGA